MFDLNHSQAAAEMKIHDYASVRGLKPDRPVFAAKLLAETSI
jgi:hypothetical protein